jgi:hypothetical protein
MDKQHIRMITTTIVSAFLIVVVGLATRQVISDLSIRALKKHRAQESKSEPSYVLLLSPQYVDTSTWNTYYNPAYGYEFKYPRSWTIQVPSSGYVQNKGVNVVNPNEMRIHEDGGYMHYDIYVGLVVRELPLPQATTSEHLAKALLGLPPGEFSLRILETTGTNGLLVYNIRKDPNSAIALFHNKSGDYQIVMDPYFIDGASADDNETFAGMYSTFRFLSE